MGGAESMTMDFFRQIAQKEFQVDFMLHTDEEGHFENEVLDKGGQIFRVPRYSVYNSREYTNAWHSFFSQEAYDVVLGHMTSTAFIYLGIAHEFGTNACIPFAHSAGENDWKKRLFRKMTREKLNRFSSKRLAVSQEAGLFTFGPGCDFEVFHNAIDSHRFRYRPAKREEFRKKLKISDQVVVGHTGRFHAAKNHHFLLKVFMEYFKSNSNTILLLVGDGERMQLILHQVDILGLKDRVIFAGTQDNVEDYLQAMDIFVFPSLYEGLPGALIEAQASGLPCLVSDRVTKEARIADNVEYIGNTSGPNAWAEKFDRLLGLVRADGSELINRAGFGIAEQTKKLEQLLRVESRT